MTSAALALAALPRAVAALVGLGSLACTSCAWLGVHEASHVAVAQSFAPYRSATVGEEDLETFLRRRTAVLVSGPATITVESQDGRLSDRTTFGTEDETTARDELRAALGAAAALTADGYFLTAAHILAAGPAHLVIESGGRILWARAREVWSDGERDVALLHAELRPEACFELLPDRALAAGEIVIAYSHWSGPAAGRLEVPVDLPAFGEYAPIAIPHDTPLRRGHSGGPVVALDGRLLGVDFSTGMDSIFLRRSWLVRPRPAELEQRIEQDRRRAR